MNVRPLTKNDVDAVIDLVNSRWDQIYKRRDSNHSNTLIRRLADTYVDMSQKLKTANHPGLLGQSLGAFDEDGKLLSAITQYFWKVEPVHYLSNMVVRPGVSTLYSVDAMGLAGCLDYAVQYAESKEYFKWFWTSETRGWNHREEQWFNNSSAFRRYHVFIDSMYKKGEQGMYPYQKTIVGKEGAGANMAIKMAVLKPELLHKYYQDKGMLKEEFAPLQYRPLQDQDKFVGFKNENAN